jgi:hypothetical protein
MGECDCVFSAVNVDAVYSASPFAKNKLVMAWWCYEEESGRLKVVENL